MDLEFRYTVGLSDRKHKLLYLVGEKHLFFRKGPSYDGTKDYYACYDGINGTPGSCKARCTLDLETKKCTRNNTPHSNHEIHDVDYRDMESLQAMKDHCKYLATNFPFSAHKIPIDDIFLTEIAK